MEKIEFTNPESKELNEEVKNYLELMRDTEALIGDGMEKLKGANWAKLWSSLDKLVFYPKTYEGNLAIFKTRCDIRYVSLFTKPAFCCDQEAVREGQSIFSYDPKGKATEAYRRVTEEVLKDAI